MKRIFICILLCFLVIIVSACQGAETESIGSVPPSFSVGESGVADAKSVVLKSHITGTEILLNDSAALEKIVNGAKLLNGSNPISSRGFYGGSFGLSFYDTAEPTEDAKSYLSFSLFCANDTEAYVTVNNMVFEEVEGHRYPAMYSVNMDELKVLETILAQYIE